MTYPQLSHFTFACLLPMKYSVMNDRLNKFLFHLIHQHSFKIRCNKYWINFPTRSANNKMKSMPEHFILFPCHMLKVHKHFRAWVLEHTWVPLFSAIRMHKKCTWTSVSSSKTMITKHCEKNFGSHLKVASASLWIFPFSRPKRSGFPNTIVLCCYSFESVNGKSHLRN